MHPNSQEKERREAESREKEREENLALNEVLREEHNAMCTVPKDFSSVGVFLTSPSRRMSRDGWEASWGGGAVLVMRPPLLG